MLSFQARREDIKKSLIKEFNYKNEFQAPQIAKIVLNMGVGEGALNSKTVDNAYAELTAISGQKPVITKASKSIAAFKLREHMPIGCKVTLRGERMYYFLEKLVVVALPRVKDFRGISVKSFDGRGNLTIGIKEQIVFSEIDYDKVDAIRGLDITIVTTARNDNEAKYLLSQFHIPFIN